MKNFLLILFALLFASSNIYAQKSLNLVMKRSEFAQWRDDELKSDIFENLPYRIAQFGSSTKNQPILIVWLHGGHSSGTDNNSHIGENSDAIGKIARYLQLTNTKAILAAPHCSEQMRENPNQTTTLLCRWIDNIIAKHGADPKRVYLIGASFGGMLVSKIASYRPDIPAAVEIIATVPHINNATKEDFAVCCIASDEGNPHKFERVQLCMAQLEQEGFNTRFVVRTGLSHREVCSIGITQTNLNWLLNFRRK